MTRYLILPLILLLSLAALLVYVGNDQWVQIQLLAQSPDVAPQRGLSMSAQAAILALTAGIIALLALWSLMLWLVKLPNRMKTGFGNKRAEHGLDAVEDALLAGESGDASAARKKAKRAHDLLGRPALTALISAKAAESAGDEAEACKHYKSLLSEPKTKAAGQRGLARLAAAKGDYPAAIKAAQAAYAPSGGPKWAFEQLFEVQVLNSDWSGALESLKTAEKRKHIAKDDARRRSAALLAAWAAQLSAAGDNETALETAQRSASTSAGFAPGVALAARLLAHDGQIKKAAKLVEKAWSQNPHPALGLAYRDLYSNDDAKALTKHIKHLVKTNPVHRESLILLTENALQNGSGVDALQTLGGLLREEEPSARLCILAGAAENLLGNEVDAKAWNIRAQTARVEADWSDLDPSGAAFKYTDKDWQRLIKSYGENGTLIHPRLEANMPRRMPLNVSLGAAEPENTEPVELSEEASDLPTPKTLKPDTAISPDDPGVSDLGDSKEDLSKRLANLLGNNSSE